MLASFARGGAPRPEDLAPLAADLQQVRYLALARIEGDETELRGDPEASLRHQRVRDGRDPHASTADRSLTTRRTVTVTLDVYDLATRPLRVDRERRAQPRRAYNFAAAGAQVPRRVVPAGEPVITAQGKPLPAADFLKVLGDACAAAAQRLLGEPRP